MIRRTFCHLPRIGVRTEERLWAAGLESWDDVVRAPAAPVPAAQRDRLERGIRDSEEILARGDGVAFTRTLPTNQHWRLFPAFRDRVAYLDIETTGLGGPGDIITTIALYDGRRVRHFVHGQNLSSFTDAIAPYRMLVTYNGKCFDAPFIERYFGIRLEQAHLDLRYILRQLGYGGGLKGCERALGLDREEVAGLDGYHAVLLWQEWQRYGRPESLDTLLAYNVEDTIHLEALMVFAYNRLVDQTPFGRVERAPDGAPPQNPFRADPATVARVLALH
ncbi:MAG: ribonuclease H-like domain-containing protein [Deltaproteobacteria bacterium]|jgi:uncharacterized protein YprB with RNaseH-like and TPR domain|nr:ribonuclease H-like domain-containing protein [Deltaproteobacteria bacterium]MBW2531914.1 ribonuclease H-like domain-containing protein [Deltaproteobacteria bacterium]